MAAQVTNYQCPSCTGPLHFVGASGKLECDYCGSTYDVAEIEAFYAEKEEKAAAAQQSAEEKTAAERQAGRRFWRSATGVRYRRTSSAAGISGMRNRPARGTTAMKRRKTANGAKYGKEC